jgi:hypothetical protein
MYDDENEYEEYRNAATVHDHTNQQGQRTAVQRIPVRPVGPVAPYGYPPPYPYAYPPGYPYPPAPQAQPFQLEKVLRTIALVVDVGVSAFAAFMPLPGAPASTGDPAKDTENLTQYQQALAQHAKTDERIRTLAKAARDALLLKARP